MGIEDFLRDFDQIFAQERDFLGYSKTLFLSKEKGYPVFTTEFLNTLYC